MTSLAIVSIISLLGWLVLMIANYRSYEVPHARMLRQVAIWVVVFALVAMGFKALGVG